MSAIRRWGLVLPLLAPGVAGAAQPAPDRFDRLREEIVRISKEAQGTVGVGLIHLESGRELFINGAEWFPLASTYKVPMAAEVLSRVDRGALGLDSLVRLEAADIVPFGSVLTERFGDGRDPGAALTVRRYLELMLTLSDNTATDVLLRLIGGTEPVNARLRALGIDSLQVSRTVMELGADWMGLTLPPRSERNVERIREMMSRLEPAQVATASRAFLASRRDHGTPEAMTRLLARLGRGEALSRASTDLLLSIMERDETGDSRIKGMLPAGTPVAHKTGTLDVSITNDVGIVTLPDGTRFAIAVYIKASRTPDEGVRSRVIAQIAAAAYHHFLFTPAGR